MRVMNYVVMWELRLVGVTDTAFAWFDLWSDSVGHSNAFERPIHKRNHIYGVSNGS